MNATVHHDGYQWVAVPDSGQMAARFAQPDKRRRYRDPDAMEKSNEAVGAR